MLDLLPLVGLGVVTFAAAVVQGALGFGFTLVAMGFFLLILGSSDVVPLLLVINLTISLSLVPRLRRDVIAPLGLRFAGGAVLGIPIGVLAFSHADVDDLKVWAGFAMLVFSALIVVSKPRPGAGQADPKPGSHVGSVSSGRSEVPRGDESFSTPAALGIGAVAGAMTSSLSMPGPAVVLYLTAIGAGRDATRATTLAFFAFAYIVSVALQTLTVGVEGQVWLTAVMLLPITAAGALVGHRLAPRVREESFRRLVLATVVGTGAYVLLDTLLW